MGVFLKSCLLFLCLLSVGHTGIIRTFYIAIREEPWNYCPLGVNKVNGNPVAVDPYASVFLVPGPQRIGPVYIKAVYRQYTDDTYTQEIPKAAWQGFLGPFIRAEVGDTIQIHLKNFASRNYSIHPHGVIYNKNSEGALYPDGIPYAQKKDDGVPPGETYTYTWTVSPEHAPTNDDDNCLTWAYHSHVYAPKDIYSGLIGALLTCKKGTLKTVSVPGSNYSQVQRTDVDQDILLLFTEMDENMSWYLEKNIHTYCTDPNGVDPNDPDFRNSNMKSSINGYVYGNLPGIELCQNRIMSWHLFGLGNEVDVHSAYFHGQTLLMLGHRRDTVSLFPAAFLTVKMTPLTTGTWLLNCQVNTHIQDGMQAFFNVSACGTQGNATVFSNATERHYFIAAELVQWNYGPSGIDIFNNVSLNDSQSPSELYFGKNDGHLGGEYMKVVFRGYTDQNFTTQTQKTSADTHLGLLGPVLRAEVGDILQVTFLNKADRTYSIQPHGLQYTKAFEGAQYDDGTVKNGSHVKPGDTFTYRWQVMEGPSASDPPCISYLYFSSTDPIKDTNSGLVGPLLVCKSGTLGSNNTRNDVSYEFFLLFSILDENLSWYLSKNIQLYGTNESNPLDSGFVDSNIMHAVNGYMYGNLPGLEMRNGSKVSWHVLGLGTEVDVHGVHFQGNTFLIEGNTRDSLSVFPHTSQTVLMQPDTVGLFEVGCKVSEHYMGGMRQQYRVSGSSQSSSAAPAAPTAKYFISAQEVEWDYSPNRTWELQYFQTTAEDSPGSTFVAPGPNRLGSKYKKVVYREYTDATFKVMKKRGDNEKHLEILGPIIRAEVGDVLQITFLNNASRPYTIRPHGLKTSVPEPVLPGNRSIYYWSVPERSGPGPSDPTCITFAYYSSIDIIKDTVSGLIGPLVVCRKGTLGVNRQRRDVNREFAFFFFIFNENKSWYLMENIKTYYNSSPPLEMNDEFEESNKMHSINGKLYGNLLNLEMQQGQKVDWYLLGMGSEVDIHTVHVHGQTFTYKNDLSHRGDVTNMFPATFQTIEIVPDNVGTWLLHCHVDDHILAGMNTVYTVRSVTSNRGTSAVGPHLCIVCILAFIYLIRHI
ncbi:ferroxidase HEPHL1-like [Hoplias malabaricus]|uniref:ferroxidase HEPHL1-like n=1 Tax=Hoplias malabaricus TaxID=27720 RepID=UPI003462AE16